MIDVGELRQRIADMPDADHQTIVERSWLEQVLVEIEAARSADALQGATFSGVRL